MSQTYTSFLDFKRRYPIRPNDEGALLGSGSYGRVIKVEDQLETEWVAIKISEFKGNDPKSLKAEVELAQRIPRQANIARYEACYRLETDTSISDFAIMKYYPDGNLADLLRSVTLTPDQIYDITKGILLGLQHLHRQRVVHRDFKPANILISRDNSGRFIPKIADFGLSKLVTSDELDSSDFDLSDGRGTPSYKAPEQIEGSRVSFNLDLWAFGVILYELLTREKPFQAEPGNHSEQSVRREIEKKIIKVDLPARLEQIEEPYRTMIRRCLVRDIHERVRKEDELLDLLDQIPNLLSEAQVQIAGKKYEKAIALYEQLLIKRENHPEAQTGIEFCRQAIKDQHITDLFKQAEAFMARQQFEQAKSNYETILQLAPNHQPAAQGFLSCINQLRPKQQYIPENLTTDLYQDVGTDVYSESVTPTQSKIVSIPILPVEIGIEKTKSDKLADPPPQLEDQPKSADLVYPARTISGKIITSILGLSLIGSIVYYTINHNSGNGQPKAPAVIGEESSKPVSDESTNEKEKSTVVPLILSEGTNKAKHSQRTDDLFNKAKQAFRERDYKNVIAFSSSALQIDPSRQDINRLYKIALKMAAESEPKNSAESESKNALPPSATPTTESEKPAEPKEDVNPKLAMQKKYDQLIVEGQKVIAKSNDKAKAIASFSEAGILAKDYELNTDKAETAYSEYMNKGDKIFNNEEYEGAKEWYKVAQALKDTRAVQSKIKQCNNQ